MTDFKRSKTGCQTCRHRKKKCDEVHPTCGGCSRNSLSCLWSDVSQPEARQRRRRRAGTGALWPRGLDIPRGLDEMVTVFAVPSRPILHRLLNHFTEFGPVWMSISPGRRRERFLHHVVPMGLGNPLTMNCILALSAADLLKYETEEPELRTIALELYGKSVAGLKAALTTKDIRASDDIILAVLLLCVHESHNFSDTNRLFPHLNAAAVLLQQQISLRPSSPELQIFLLEMFSYFFALTAFSHGPSLAIAPASQIFNSFKAQNNHTPGQSLLLGSSQELIITIFRISMLTMNPPPGMILDEVVRSELEEIESQLQGLDGARGRHYNNICPDDAVLFELYRLACLVYVKKTLDPQVSAQTPALQRIVACFIDQLDTLSEDSPLNGLLGWPLVVVGLCAVVHTHQRIIMGRLRIIHKTWRTDIFIRNMDFLRQQWRLGVAIDPCRHSNRSSNEALSPYFTSQDLSLPAALV